MSSCGTNRCALRRFDGHGMSSYRPTNPEAVRQMDTSLQRMMEERQRQDIGIFTPIVPPSQEPKQDHEIVTVKPIVEIPKSHLKKFYSLSDAS